MATIEEEFIEYFSHMYSVDILKKILSNEILIGWNRDQIYYSVSINTSRQLYFVPKFNDNQKIWFAVVISETSPKYYCTLEDIPKTVFDWALAYTLYSRKKTYELKLFS